MKTYHVGILLFDGVDALDFVGPYEVFNMTTFHKKDVKELLTNYLDNKPFKVYTVSQEGKPIKANHGLMITPDYCFQKAPVFDLILVPGGTLKTIQTVLKNKEVVEWVARNNDAMIASVCTGAIILAESGLLKGKRATTNRAALGLLTRAYPDTEVVKDVKYVDEGKVITSAGVSSGINMALYIVQKLVGEEASKRTAETIEYLIEEY